MTSQDSARQWRNNGRAEACVPCRKRKVACDHVRPVCSRCTTRKHPEACEYRDTIIHRRERGTRPRDESTLVASAEQHVPALISRTTDSATEITPGYLGFTSFYRTFNEASITIPNALSEGISISQENIGLPHATSHTLDSALKTSVAVLRHLPERDKAIELLKAHYDPHDGWIRSIAEITLIEFYDTFEAALSEDSSQRQLENLAHLISENTSRPFQEDEPDSRKWIDQFSGKRTRWETLGILFSHWEFGERSNVIQDDRLVESLQNCVEHCFCMGKKASLKGNCMLLFLSWKRTVCRSLTAGSANLPCWETHAETVALLTFLGWHAIPAQEQGTPTLASEIKHRLNITIYIGDKLMASFAGRPPLISRKYLLTPLPLDLEDDVLLTDASVRQSAAALLCNREWRHHENLCRATFLRARARLAFIREEILELALGGQSCTSAAALEDLRSRAERVFADFPAPLRLGSTKTMDQRVDAPTLHMRLIAHLEHLLNLFFIERLLIRNHWADKDNLLFISYKMVSTTLLYWKNMDRLSALRTDFQWLVMAYAAPGGGILCLELIRPSMASNSQDEPLSRSNIIQQLSLLVGFLDWGVSTAKTPNSGLCAACKAIIERVLDYTLNAPPNSHLTPNAMDLGSLTQLDFDFDLLDTFDWMPNEVSQLA